MAKAEYRWIQTFVIQDDEGELNVGDTVEVVKSNGEAKLVVVKFTYPYVTKSGKHLTRAIVEDA